jgi:hypothetical protein
VVEFWATWCGPCRTSIPHLTDLQKKHPDVTFIGVSVFERQPGLVKPFVKEMGEKMDYRVAEDAVKEGEDSNDGAMATKWMKAAEQNGIPTAFIVNKQGSIAWIGHPMEMDGPLEKIAAGSWDLKVEAERIRKEKDVQKAEASQMQKFAQNLNQAMRSGDGNRILSVIDEIVQFKPALELRLAPMKLGALLKLDQQDKALELGKQLEKGPMGQDPQGLNALSWTIVSPASGIKPGPELLKFALEMARRADDKTNGKNGQIADTLAKAYFDSGEVAKAIETQERALSLSKKLPKPQLNEMEERLEQYKKAAGK